MDRLPPSRRGFFHLPLRKLFYNTVEMTMPIHQFRQLAYRFLVIWTVVVLLVSCQLLPSGAASNSTGNQTTPPPGVEPLESPQAPPLPPVFQTALLNPVDVPRAYLDDTCKYLRNKWHPASAEPGTVVMIVLIRHVSRGGAEEPDGITAIDLPIFMNELKAQGFAAITTKQLQAFMERNVRIPPRSVLLIQDGNHPAEYFEKIYGEYWRSWGWPIVNGWINEPALDEDLIRGNVELERAGFVDHQARGVIPAVKLSDESSKTVVARELQGSVYGLAEHFAKNPTAIIWPNGGFGIRPVDAARQLRFKLGITQNARGPLMYNWVPLADEYDPLRPRLIPEGKVNVPLMTLPSFSPAEAWAALDAIRAIGKEAAEYHLAHKEIEREYYRIVCEAEYGRIPEP